MADVPLMENPMTTAEDLIVGGASGAPSRLALGSDTQVLTVSGTAVAWAAAPSAGSTETWDEVLTDLSANLVDQWLMDEASGNFVDTVESLALVASGTITYQQAGPRGATSAAAFASGAKAAAATMGSAPVTSAARTSVVLMKATAAGGLTGSQQVIAWGTSGSTRLYWATKVNDTATYQDSTVVWADDLQPTLTGCSDGNWHLIASGYDAQSTTYFYKDGQLYVRRLSGSLNTGTTVKPTLMQSGTTAITVDEAPIFDKWIGKHNLDRLYRSLAGLM